MYSKSLIGFFCLVCYFTTIGQSSSVQISGSADAILLDPYIWVFEDTSFLSVLSILALPDSVWEKDNGQLRFGTNKNCWIKVGVNPDKTLDDWSLRMAGKLLMGPGFIRGIDSITCFLFQGGNLVSKVKQGKKVAYQRDKYLSPYNEFAFPISIDKTDPITILLKVNNENSFEYHPLNAMIQNDQISVFRRAATKYESKIWVITGFMLFAFVFHIILFLFTKRVFFGYFLIWLVCTLIASFMTIPSNPIIQVAFPSSPQVGPYLWSIFSSGVWIAFWLFGKSVLETKIRYPRFNKLINYLILFDIVLRLVELYSISDSSFNPMDSPILSILDIGLRVAGMMVCVLIFKKGNSLDKFFSIFAFFGLLTPLVGLLWHLSIIRLSFDPYITGVLFQIVAYSFFDCVQN